MTYELILFQGFFSMFRYYFFLLLVGIAPLSFSQSQEEGSALAASDVVYVHDANYKFCKENVLHDYSRSVKTSFFIKTSIDEGKAGEIIKSICEKQTIYKIEFRENYSFIIVYHLSSLDVEDVKNMLTSLEINSDFHSSEVVDFH